MKENTTNDEREFTFSETEYNALMAEQKEARMKNLRRHKLPGDLSLEAALNGMTKQELEDIQYNLNLPMATNINRVKKGEMVTAILPAVVDFAGKWFVSAFDQQKELFDFFATQKEAVTAKEISDFRLDYLRGIGVLFCGMSEGELLWYMPEEVKEAYGKINSGAYTSAVALNTEAMRLAAGFVFYYGIMDYDALHNKVNELLDEKLDFAEFMGVIFNGGCWYEHIIAGQHELMSADLMNPEALQEAQGKQGQLDYAQFPYDKVYEAGDENYIESTAAYRALAQFFMKKKNLDVLQAAEAVKSITIILQNGYNMPEILSFLADNKLRMDSMAENDELYGLIGRFQHNQPLWMLKGHTPAQLENMPKVSVVREGNKVGRNDPCPCGSGKKFKKCCINKVY